MRLIEYYPGHLVPLHRIRNLRATLPGSSWSGRLATLYLDDGSVVGSDRALEDLRAEIERPDGALPMAPLIEIGGGVFAANMIVGIDRVGGEVSVVHLSNGKISSTRTPPEEHARAVEEWKAARSGQAAATCTCSTIEQIREALSRIDEEPRR